MNEIVPGLYHWSAMHPRIKHRVSSYFVADSGTLLDPIFPEDGIDWFRRGHEPNAIVLTNRHHHRDAERFCAEFGIGPVLVPESGLHEFEDKHLQVRGYAVGEEVMPGIVCHEVGAICPDDMALEIRSAGALAFADGLINEAGVGFVPDQLMDEPEKTKQGLLRSLEELLDVDFDTLLFAHGEPIVGDGKRTLRDFVARQTQS